MVGGGNVAVDVALTALAVGAREVTMACLESREEMPASPWEIDQAIEEGVRLMPSWGPHRIIGENGKIKAIELVTCTCVFDEKGNFCPAFGEEKETVEADQVILAIGQSAELSFLSSCGGVKSERGLIVVDPKPRKRESRGCSQAAMRRKAPAPSSTPLPQAGGRPVPSIDFSGGDGLIGRPLRKAARFRVIQRQA